MKTITLKNINTRSGFLKVAQAAVDLSRGQRALVRFTMGPTNARQTFTASPKKPVATLVWEWSKSPAGMVTKRTRKVSALGIAAAVHNS